MKEKDFMARSHFNMLLFSCVQKCFFAVVCGYFEHFFLTVFLCGNLHNQENKVCIVKKKVKTNTTTLRKRRQERLRIVYVYELYY